MTETTNLVFQYWENSEMYPEGINFIKLCQESVDLHSHASNPKSYKIIRLNEKTIFDYLDVKELNPYIFNLKNSENQIAQKVDYFRVKLLKKYGGLWLDSEAIMLRDDISYIFDKLQKYEFFGYKKHDTPNIWAFACKPNAEIMNLWDENNEKILNETKGENIFYGELGHQSLCNFILPTFSKCYWEDLNQIEQLQYEYNFKFFYIREEEAYKKFLDEKLPFVMIFNGLTDKIFKTFTREYFLNENILFSQLIKFSGILK